MRERGSHFAIPTSRICMPEIVTNESNGSLIKEVSASMSRDSECAPIATTTNNTDHVRFSKIMLKCDRQRASHYPWTTELQENGKAKLSETNLVVHTDGTEEEDIEENDCQLVGNMSCHNFACLNVNSNGRRTTSEEVNTVKESNTEAENSDSAKQRKQFIVGQFPFEPVGLSLSSSGVQLYMMVDYNDQQKMLPKVEPEIAISACKNLEKTGKINTGNSQMESFSNVNDTRSCRNVHDIKDNKMDVSYNNGSQRIGLGTVEEPLQVGAVNRLQATQENRKRTYICNSKDNKQQTPCCSNVMTPRSVYLEDKCADAQAMMSGPSWRFDNEEIDVSNNEDNRDTFRRIDRYPEGCHQDKKVKRHYRNSSSDDDEDMQCQDDLGMKSTRATKTRTMTAHTTHRKKYAPVHSRMVINEHTDSHLMSQPTEVSASSTSVFKANRSTSTISADQMAKFKEYTETIRRNLKDDYRNLSNLIKSFSEEVEERNNNQSSLSRSHFNQPDNDEKTKNNDRCYLM